KSNGGELAACIEAFDGPTSVSTIKANTIMPNPMLTKGNFLTVRFLMSFFPPRLAAQPASGTTPELKTQPAPSRWQNPVSFFGETQNLFLLFFQERVTFGKF